MSNLDLSLTLVGRDAGASNALRNVGQAAEGASKSFSSLGTIIAGVGLGTALEKLGEKAMRFGKESLDAFKDVGKEVLKLQRYTGDSAEAMSKLRFAAEESGVSADTLAGALGKMSKAADSGKLEEYGIAIRDNSGLMRSAGDIFIDVAGKIGTMQNGVQKTAAILAIFGRAGMDIAPLLNRGADGIAKFSEEAEKMGLVLSGENLKAVKDNVMAQRELDAAIKGAQVAFGQYLYPTLTTITKAISELTVVGGQALQSTFTNLDGPVTALAANMKDLAGWIGQNRSVIVPVVQLFATLGTTALAAAAGVGALHIVQTIGGWFTVANTAIQKFAMSLVDLAVTKSGLVQRGLWGMAQGVSALGYALPAVGVAAVAAAALFIKMGVDAEESKRRIQALTDAIREDSGAIGENTRLTLAKQLADQGLVAAGKELGLTAKDVLNYFLGQPEAITKAESAMARYTGAMVASGQASANNPALKLGDAYRAQAGEIDKAAKAQQNKKEIEEAATGATQDNAGATEDATQKYRDLAAAANDAAKQIDEQTKSLWANVDAKLASKNDDIAWRQALLNTTSALEKNGTTLRNNTEEGLNNQSNLTRSIGAMKSEIQGMIERGATAEEVAAKDAEMRAEFAKTAAQFGTNAGQAKAMYDQYMLTPTQLKTAVELQGAETAKTKLADLYKAIGEISDPQWQVKIKTQIDQGNLPEALRLLKSYQTLLNEQEQSKGLSGVGALRQFSANGNIFHYAGGGEYHAAQIAQAGAMRVWAEPETGGEAYIPLSPAKRDRSLSIWQQTGQMLGVNMGGGSTSTTINLPVTVSEKFNAALAAREIAWALT